MANWLVFWCQPDMWAGNLLPLAFRQHASIKLSTTNFEPMLWRVCRQLIAANTAAPCMTLISKYYLAVCCFTSNKSAVCAVCVVCIDNCTHHITQMAMSAVSESHLCVVCSYSCVHHRAPKPVQLCLSPTCMWCAVTAVCTTVPLNQFSCV